MRNIRQMCLGTLATAAIVAIGMVPSARAAEYTCNGVFDDVAADNKFCPYIEYLSYLDISKGDKGNYLPAQDITRGATAKFIVEGMNLPIDTNTTDFVDVKTDNHFYTHIKTLKKHGIANGYTGGKFEPDKPISRQEFSQLIIKSIEYVAKDKLKPTTNTVQFGDVAKDNKFYAAILSAKENGIVKGYEDGNFYPGRNITRAEAARLVTGGIKVAGRQRAYCEQEYCADMYMPGEDIVIISQDVSSAADYYSFYDIKAKKHVGSTIEAAQLGLSGSTKNGHGKYSVFAFANLFEELNRKIWFYDYKGNLIFESSNTATASLAQIAGAPVSKNYVLAEMPKDKKTVTIKRVENGQEKSSFSVAAKDIFDANTTALNGMDMPILEVVWVRSTNQILLSVGTMAYGDAGPMTENVYEINFDQKKLNILRTENLEWQVANYASAKGKLNYYELEDVMGDDLRGEVFEYDLLSNKKRNLGRVDQDLFFIEPQGLTPNVGSGSSANGRYISFNRYHMDCNGGQAGKCPGAETNSRLVYDLWKNKTVYSTLRKNDWKSIQTNDRYGYNIRGVYKKQNGEDVLTAFDVVKIDLKTGVEKVIHTETLSNYGIESVEYAF